MSWPFGLFHKNAGFGRMLSKVEVGIVLQKLWRVLLVFVVTFSSCAWAEELQSLEGLLHEKYGTKQFFEGVLGMLSHDHCIVSSGAPIRGLAGCRNQTTRLHLQ